METPERTISRCEGVIEFLKQQLDTLESGAASVRRMIADREAEMAAAKEKLSPLESSRHWVLSEHGECPGCGDRTYYLMDGDVVLKEKCSSCGWQARTDAWFLSDRNDPEQ